MLRVKDLPNLLQQFKSDNFYLCQPFNEHTDLRGEKYTKKINF